MPSEDSGRPEGLFKILLRSFTMEVIGRTGVGVGKAPVMSPMMLLRPGGRLVNSPKMEETGTFVGRFPISDKSEETAFGSSVVKEILFGKLIPDERSLINEETPLGSPDVRSPSRLDTMPGT